MNIYTRSEMKTKSYFLFVEFDIELKYQNKGIKSSRILIKVTFVLTMKVFKISRC